MFYGRTASKAMVMKINVFVFFPKSTLTRTCFLTHSICFLSHIFSSTAITTTFAARPRRNTSLEPI